MTTPTGEIGLLSVQSEFGGQTPISFSEYFAGGGYVQAGLSGVPASGQISLGNLRGKSKVASSYGALSASSLSISEGDGVTFTLAGGTAVPSGSYFWRIEGTGITSADFVSASGMFSVANNAGSFRVTTAKDGATEGAEQFRAVVGSDAAVSTALAASAYVSVSEAAVPPVSSGTVYSCNWTPSAIYAGQLTTLTVSASKSVSQDLYFTLAGSASYSDLEGVTSATGAIPLYGTSRDISFYAASDLDVSNETMTIALRESSGTAGPIVASASLVIRAYSPMPSTLQITKIGGAAMGQSIELRLQIASITANFADRGFYVWYRINLGEYKTTGLTLTVPSGATQSNLLTVYGPVSAALGNYTVQYKVTRIGTADIESIGVASYL